MKGIGPKSIASLNRIGIFKVEDFVTYYPYRYELIKCSNLDITEDLSKVIIDGMIESIPVLNFYGHKKNTMRFFMHAQNRQLQVVIYNRAYLKRMLFPGKEITVIGKYEKKYSRIVVSEIRFGKIEKETIERVYHLTEGISRKNFTSYVDMALTFPYSVVDYIPRELNEKYHLIEKEVAIKEIHHPTNTNLLKEARKKLIYEELFCYMLKVEHLKQTRKKDTGIERKESIEPVFDFIETLPFSLTEDQQKSLNEILNDMKTPYQMNRLLQGDVGSGKTIVAILAMYYNTCCGYQSAFMAPTEILARQHYESLLKLFDNTNIQIGLLTGSMKKTERKQVLKELEEGRIDILVGTHALISDDVTYSNLGLVITDEQHRFGVEQRTRLKRKGDLPDMLSMSATPIPRTYALTVYGDMDLSNIETMPSGRKAVTTLIRREEEIKDVLTRMYEELKKGHQVYVIAPLICDMEDSDKNDVETVYQNMEKAFGKRYKIGRLHGQMKAGEKEEVMDAFKRNESQILISTTVIEVGVDVKNATMIVIFNAEQFGLATLHQLRGRVGRNDFDCSCILISNEEKERLQILVQSNNGFEISEEDFKMRGGGDLFGNKQSGDMVFKIADLKRDFKTLQLAKLDSEEFIKSKAFLKEENEHIRNMLDAKRDYVS